MIIVLKERYEMDSIKIIIMVTWIGLNVLQGTESDDDVFTIGNGRCITNGSAALAIIKKINDIDAERDNKLASYYPESESKCTFEKTTTCGKEDFWESNSWNIYRAMDGPVNHYVTDRRWQDFPVHKFLGMTSHKKVLELNNFKIFTIPLSLRIERMGIVQISLCDYMNRDNVDCYCIMLTETNSGIWKCSQLYTIDDLNYENPSCKKLDNAQASKPFGFFNEDAWTHLSIVRKHTMIQVLKENDAIITYYDEKPIYDTKRVLIHSKGSSLWKVHDYYYLFSETPNESSDPIGPVILISKDTTCISMFVAMCKTCCLTITISLKKNGEPADATQHHLSTRDGMWAEKKLIIDTHNYVGHSMSLLQYKTKCYGDSNQGLFWAIDDIRLCEEKEYSYIESDKKNFTCQKIGIGQNEILKIDNNEISEKGNDCPENTFGKSCLPCSMFGNENDYCDAFVYCDLDHSEEACHCTAGYGGINCLAAPSKVREVEAVSDAASISLKWKEPVRKNGNIIRYDIVYYYLGSTESSCASAHEMFNASTKQLNFILEGLKVYSKYQIMIYAVTNGGQGEEYKKMIGTNQTDDISPDEMLATDTLEVFSDSVKISLTKIDCEDLTGPIHLQGNASCIHEWCAEKNVSKRVKYSPDSNYIKLINLLPYSNYTAYVVMSRDRTSWIDIGHVTFQTKPSVPNNISNLELISKDDTSISLRWMKPYPPTGILKQYVIKYSYYLYYSATRIHVDPEYLSPQPCPLWKDYHCANLTKRISKRYTYDVQIHARNENPDTYGGASQIIVKIQDEVPHPTYGISLLWDEKNDLKITWYHPNNTNGPLKSFQIQLYTKKNQPILEEYAPVRETNYSLTYTKTVNSTKLRACTKYTASIVVHNHFGASPSKDSSATSPPDIPPNIPKENLETEMTNTTITVHVPDVGRNSTNCKEKIYILVSKAADDDDLELFEQNLLKSMDGIPNLKSSRVVYHSNRTKSPLDFRIGDNNQSDSSLNNPPLEPGTNYSVSIIMSNQGADMMRLSRTQKYVSTLMKMDEVDEHTSDHLELEDSNGGLWALILLLFVPLIGFGYWYKKYKHQKWSDLLIPNANPDNGGVRKYAICCWTCGGLAAILGVSFLAVHFLLRPYTSSLGYFETIPSFVPAILLILTGICVMSLTRKKNRHSYLLRICSLCCLGCALTCVLVVITTTVSHMNRLQTLRECVYTQKTRTCTCYSVLLEAHATADDGTRYVFDETSDCRVIHGALYSCLKAMFGLSVSGILVCIFSCMLVCQLLSHEKKKIYWEQLLLRFRSFYQQQSGLPTHCSCCEECRNRAVPPDPQGSPCDSNIYHYVVHHNQGHESYCEMNDGNSQFRNKNNYENTTEPRIYQEPEATGSEVHTSVRNDGQDSSIYEEVLQTQTPDANPMKPVTEDVGYLEPKMCNSTFLF